MAISQCARFLMEEPAICYRWLREDAVVIAGWHMPGPGLMRHNFAPNFFVYHAIVFMA